MSCFTPKNPSIFCYTTVRKSLRLQFLKRKYILWLSNLRKQKGFQSLLLRGERDGPQTSGLQTCHMYLPTSLFEIARSLHALNLSFRCRWFITLMCNLHKWSNKYIHCTELPPFNKWQRLWQWSTNQNMYKMFLSVAWRFSA